MSITTIPVTQEHHTPIVMQAAQDDPFFSQDASSLGLMNLEMTSAEDLGYNWEECDLTENTCMQSMVNSAQGMELWSTFQSYVADHNNFNPADETNIADLAINQEAPTIETALGLSPMKEGKEMDLKKSVAYFAMVQLFPWEEAFYAIEDAADLAKEMGKRGYKLFRKSADKSVGFMKPKLQNMARFGDKMKSHAHKGWVKIRPVVSPLPEKVMNMTKNTHAYLKPKFEKLVNQTKNAANKHAPQVVDTTKTGFEAAKNIANKHIVPGFKNVADKVKNISIQHVWPNIIKPSTDYILSGKPFQAVMNGFKKLHQTMPWAKSSLDDDYMFYDFYEIKVDKEEDLYN